MNHKIVCDTNIWYYIENGKINLDNYTIEYPLCSTFLNLHELFTTPRWFSDPDLVFRVIDTMIKNSKIILLNPNQHIYNFATNSINNSRENPELEINSRFVLFEKAKLDYYSPIKAKPIFEEWLNLIKEYQEFYKNLADDAYDLSLHLTKIADRKKYKAQFVENKKQAKIRLEESITERFEKLFGIQNIPKSLTDEFELFNTVSDFALKAIVVENYRVHENDFEDLDMLLYVQKGDLYWTAEERWRNLIIKSNMGHYLKEKPKI